MSIFKILSVHEFSKATRYCRIGSFQSTRTAGCYKLFLDYIPHNSDSRLLIVPADDSSTSDIMQNAWLPEPSQMTHRVYGYADYPVEADSQINRNRDRIGSVFSTRKEHVYTLSMWFWPRQPDTDVLAFELSTDDILSQG